jgi:hypothetical protein
MAKKVSINYFFIFDKADDGWQNIRDFERDLADFFGAYGFGAEVVQTIEGSASRMIMLKRAEVDEKLTNMKGPTLTNMKPKAEKSAALVNRLTGQMQKSYDKGGKK